ncbi:MAG: M20/M25/M40 family metallo-hydrolase [Holophagaceae bacterium]|nr:M20/M25/M40 family metallo-hydrolase [Holophagaceae bacterium]
MGIKNIFPTLFLVALVGCDPAPQTSQTSRGEAAIRGQDAVATVARLSDKSTAGRQTGDVGYTNAAKYSLSRLKSMGLKGELQSYPQAYSILDGGSLVATVKEETVYTAEMIKDFIPLLFSDSGQAKAPSVFAGWGIHAPELGYDDYAGIDVKGKYILCFRGTPENDPKWVYHDEHRTRMKVASDRGAIGLIYVYSSIIAHNNGDLIPQFYTAMISDTFFDKLIAIKGTTTEDLTKRLRETKKPASFALEATIDLSVKARYFPNAEGYNVVAWLPGSDPALKDECVVIGAHLDGVGDHLGLRFPCAEDNASGSAAVIEIAKAFVKNKIKPKRGVVFVLFGSEEQGGAGSAFFAENLPPQFKKISAMINFDMVGIGTKLNGSMSELMEAHREKLSTSDQGLEVLGNIRTLRAIGVRSGDIVPFFRKGVPLISLSSNGPRPADLYHLPGDTPNLMQPELLEKVSKLMYRFAFELCDLD